MVRMRIFEVLATMLMPNVISSFVLPRVQTGTTHWKAEFYIPRFPLLVIKPRTELNSLSPLLYDHSSRISINAKRIGRKLCSSKIKKFPSSSTALSSSMPIAAAVTTATGTSSFPVTASTWIGSALLGYIIEQRILRDTGIPVTLTVSAIICPSSPLLSNLCWNFFLPASLVLLLLSLNEDDAGTIKGDTGTVSSMTKPFESTINNSRNNNRNSIPRSVQRLTVPFVLASIGSFLGGLFTFLLCCYAYTATGNPASTWATWLLSPHEARIALSCLIASFIGGSVNFFSTASSIMLAAPFASAFDIATTTAMMGSMAKSYLVVIAIYFPLLTFAVNSNALHKIFTQQSKQIGNTVPSKSHRFTLNSNRRQERTSEKSMNSTSLTNASNFVEKREKAKPFNVNQINIIQSAMAKSSNNAVAKTPRPAHTLRAMVNNMEGQFPPVVSGPITIMEAVINNVISKAKEPLAEFQATFIACTTAFAIVKFAAWVESRLMYLIPGIGYAVIAIVTPWIQHPRNSPLPISWREWYRKKVPAVSRPLSKLSLLLLFASLGSTIRQLSTSIVTSATTQAELRWLETGPACTVVSFMALSVHCLFTMISSWLWIVLAPTITRSHKNTIHSHDKHAFFLEDVLVASGAAIAGPASAAGFCGRIHPASRRSSSFLKGLTYAATVWGVVGYAVGTTIGVLSYRLFGWLMTMMGVAPL